MIIIIAEAVADGGRDEGGGRVRPMASQSWRSLAYGRKSVTEKTGFRVCC